MSNKTEIDSREKINKNLDIFTVSETVMNQIYSKLKFGGRQKISSKFQNVAIIVPYRNRPSHLSKFLRHMHYFLHRQPINYGIFVVEQIQNQTFNRGKLMNVGFLEALKEKENWSCFFFHDVDMLPENLANIYKCEYLPKHFSAAIDLFNYSVPYSSYFGGVSAMSRSFFERINGYSNEFWGWGGEDDEIRRRIFAVDMIFYRIRESLGRYRMHKHLRDEGNAEPPLECRFKLINEVFKRFHIDGIANIEYKKVKKEMKLQCTHLLIDLEEEVLRQTSPFRC